MAKRGRKKKAEIESTPKTEAAEPKQRGRKSQYDAETKATILKATADARKAGMTWEDALVAAKACGFKGTLPYLMKMGRDSGAVKIRRNKRGRPAGKSAAKRGPGRPAKVKVRVSGAASLGDIDKIVANMVESRVSAAIYRAVAALERTAAELRKL